MKFIFFISVVLLLFSCKKTENKKQGDYLQCKVNGKDWQSGCTGAFDNCEDLYFANKRHNLLIAFYNDRGNSVSIGLYDSLATIKSGIYYIDSEYGRPGNVGAYRDYDRSFRFGFYTSIRHTGEVQIEIDEVNKTVKGNFRFVAKYQENEDSVIVSDGYFQGKYKIY